VETEKQKGKRPTSENGNLTQYSTPTKRSRIGPQSHSAEDHKKDNQNKKRTQTPTDNQEPIQDKLLFTIITNEVITMMKIKGVRALDELAGSNKGKKTDYSQERMRKKINKGKRNGSRHRAERVVVIHEMTIEEARNTEVSITGTERGRYGNAHFRYDINDGLVGVILEVTPTEEQRAERVREQKEQKGKRRMAKETEHEIQEKYRPRHDEIHEMHARNTPSRRKRRKDSTHKV
jgi:hypothetical protein